jgi:FMN phosphatase YigB (HAD superfamily)
VRELGIPRAEAVLVDDEQVQVVAATAMGIRAVLIRRGSADISAAGDTGIAVVRDMAEVEVHVPALTGPR